MRSIFLIAFCCIMAVSCTGSSNDKENQLEVSMQRTDTLQSFSVIEKDSVWLIDYRFSKQVQAGGIIVFNYNSNKGNFNIGCDTAKRIYKVIWDNADTVVLQQEAEKWYTINGKDFKVLKLIMGKGVTDGETSWFLSTETGWLIRKSNTWRIAEVLNPDKGDRDYIRLTALLYRISTDEELFKNPIPKIEIKKFTPPKLSE